MHVLNIRKDQQVLAEMLLHEAERLYPSCDNKWQIIFNAVIRKNSVAYDERRTVTEKVNLIFIAHVRHRYTRYTELTHSGISRSRAREMVSERVNTVLTRWSEVPETAVKSKQRQMSA